MRWLILALLVTACGSGMSRDQADRDNEAINFDEIQRGVMSFTDNWFAQVGMRFDELLMTIDDPEVRIEAKRLRYISLLSSVDIASGPHPGLALLDMMVFSSLSRATWDNYWLPRYPEAGMAMSGTLGRMEQDIWEYSSAYLDREQLQEIRGLVEQWIDQNPNRWSAALVRFSDFGSLGRAPGIDAERRPGGLFAAIRQVNTTAETIRETGERALFLGMRLQELIAERAELSALEMLNAPEIAELRGQIADFSATASEYAALIEAMPNRIDGTVDSAFDRLGSEREAAVIQVMEEFDQKRERAIADLMQRFASEREAAVDQVLGGVREERNALSTLTVSLVLWFDLQAKAMFARFFVLAACLILLYFLLRIVYGYMQITQESSAPRLLLAVGLLTLTAIPVIIIGIGYVEYSRPDIERIKQMEQDLRQAPAVSETADDQTYASGRE